MGCSVSCSGTAEVYSELSLLYVIWEHFGIWVILYKTTAVLSNEIEKLVRHNL